MTNTENRFGTFTSSGIHALLSVNKSKDGFGKPALTYIRQRAMERRLGRALSSDRSARPTSWGNMCESYVFNQRLGLDYTLTSQDSIIHPKYPFWTGRPDGCRYIAEKTVFDVKCPWTMLSFCTLIDAWERGGIEAIREEHESGEAYYQQLVSNAILTESTHAELIVFCPYLSEIPALREWSDGNPDYYWLTYVHDEELPYLIEGGYYKNINVLRFEIPQADKDALEDVVQKAEALISTPNLIAA